MKSEGDIAKISLEPKTHNVKNVTIYTKNLRFKCKRCATFCCKLGGPKLSVDDVERLKQAGYEETEFLDAVTGSLKNRSDGACVFLRLQRGRDVYECSVYDARPTLCRLYPFYFQKMSPHLFILRLMPCRGISRSPGEPVDERFLIDYLFNAFHDSVSTKFY